MRRLPSLSSLLPVAIGSVALAVTVALWHHERQLQVRNLRGIFDLGVRQTANRIEERLSGYEQVLRGAQGFFEASDRVDREAFASYVDALRGGADFTGLQAIAYAPRLSRSQLAAHVAAERGNGAPDYSVSAPGELDIVAPVASISPMRELNRRMLGHDLYADPTRRAAMLRAGDSGGAQLTTRIAVPTDAGPPKVGFVMFLPLYEKKTFVNDAVARRAYLTGWVLASFNVDDLMSSLYGEGTPGLAIRIQDGVDTRDDTPIYDSAAEPSAASPARPARAARFEAQEFVGYAGHTWTLRISTLPAFEERYSDESARIILIAGSVGSLLLTLLTWQLVTGRARAHEAARAMTGELRVSEERYRRIVETANEGIWLIDSAGRTSFINPKLAHMLGLGDDESGAAIIGRPVSDFIEGPLPSGDRADERDVRIRRPDGGELWVTLSTTAIVEADGRPAGMLAMVIDVTDQKLAEVRRALLEAQLLESQKMEAIGTLAGGIAHDFNNILAAILGNVALSQQQLGPDHPARAELDQIRVAGVRARSLVHQITAFSRREPQQLINQPLRPLIEESIRLMRSTLPAMVEIELQLTDLPLRADADSTQLQQVLLNLCTNAWHALDGGAGRIVIGLAPQALDAEAAQRIGGLLPGPHAVLSVADNGIGMDASVRARIFEPFYTTKPVGRGTGLGLSVVHGIISAHHGAISVSSEPGEGSRFDVFLPLRQPPTEAAAPASLAPSLPRGHGEHVLCIDDDAVMAVMVTGLLQSAGYRVTTFEDPRAALVAVRADPEAFDLVVTDFNMPEVSGLDVARELARLRPTLPVIVSSGYVTDEMRTEAEAIGVRALMQKEYTIEQLGDLVQRTLLLTQRTAAADPQSAPATLRE